MKTNLSFEEFLTALSALKIGQTYKYASAGRPTFGYCELVSLDIATGAIRYRRNGETKIENIAGNNVEKLATALASRRAVEVNSLYGGSGNFRSALEALAANTEHVFVCQIGGKKHIFWNPEASHPVGKITLSKPPSIYAPENTQLHTSANDETLPRQLITYGAPGTGKSFKIKNETTGQKVFRTTFHPDSDYATFVGAYKPVMNEVERTVLVGKKLEMADVGSVKEELKKESVITYEFVEQVFTKAYIEAWGCQKAANADEEPKRIYLVIEEINRGNCAQIFGDLFQLLDRNGKGFSEYPIRPDSDFGKHIATALGKKKGTFDEGRKARINALYPEVEEGVDIVEEVLSGRYLLLPDNLFIRATMNTSDQSLFPMDSAFKRRWDWDYVPIEDHPEESWEIEIDPSTHYKWWDFLDAINKEIFKATSSEDKQLGYFFVQAKGGKIDLDTFVNKVVFYLWNSVFKDCYTDCGFMKKDKEKDSYFIFTSFFKSGKPDAEQAKAFLGNLEGVKSVEAKEDEAAKDEAKAQADGEVASDDDGQSAGNG